MSKIFSLLEICKIPEIISCIFAIIIKEFSKVCITSKLGDPMPRLNNTITLNPKKFIDPLGFIMMVIYGYGWNKPAETTSLYYKDRKKGTIITHLTPLIINILIGIIFIFITKGLYNFTIYKNRGEFITNLLMFLYLVFLKISLMNFKVAVVNLIPIHPFEMAKIVKEFLKQETVVKYNYSEKIWLTIFAIFTFLGITGQILNFIISKISFGYLTII